MTPRLALADEIARFAVRWANYPYMDLAIMTRRSDALASWLAAPQQYNGLVMRHAIGYARGYLAARQDRA